MSYDICNWLWSIWCIYVLYLVRSEVCYKMNYDISDTWVEMMQINYINVWSTIWRSEIYEMWRKTICRAAMIELSNANLKYVEESKKRKRRKSFHNFFNNWKLFSTLLLHQSSTIEKSDKCLRVICCLLLCNFPQDSYSVIIVLLKHTCGLFGPNRRACLSGSLK